jgi:hypothetical protein
MGHVCCLTSGRKHGNENNFEFLSLVLIPELDDEKRKSGTCSRTQIIWGSTSWFRVQISQPIH